MGYRTGTLGDHREKIKDLATLIGFEVIEEDKQEWRRYVYKPGGDRERGASFW